MKRCLLVVSGLAACLIALAGCSSGGNTRPAAAEPTPGLGSQAYTITTQATGRAKATPDTLTVTLGVQTRDASARAALTANNEKTTALLNQLKGSGVAAKDLQTVDLSIQPNYTKSGEQITGYQVTNTVRATFHDLKNAGSVIDAAAATVGNAVRIQQMGFSVSDDTAVQAQARTKAVQQAQDQAQQIAKASGSTLGRIRTITEAPAQLNQPTLDAAIASAAKSVPIQAGQLEITVDIQITYDIS